MQIFSIEWFSDIYHWLILLDIAIWVCICMICVHSVTNQVTKMQFHTFSFLLGAAVPVYAAGLRNDDTIYNPLPLYHSSAGMLCCGPSFFIGCTIALRKKFSAKAYWKDCVKYNATVSTHHIRNTYFYRIHIQNIVIYINDIYQNAY